MGQRASVRPLAVIRLLGLALSLWMGAAGGYAAQMTLPPISPADKALKQCPEQPGAPAVYLYRGRLTSDADGTFSACYRLKILTSAGKDYASIEIPYSEAWEVRGIRASVMNPDGRLVFFNGEILDKTILQVGGLKRMVKTFALPDVDVGSIISYSYELKWNPKMAAAVRNLSLERWKPEEGGIPNNLKPYAFTTEAWDFDAPLYTYKAKYAYIPLGGGEAMFDEDHRLHLAWVSYGLPWGPPVLDGGRVELEVDNIPAREKEEWAAPEEDGRMGVIFFFCSTKILRALDYWNLEGAGWQKAAQRFMAVNSAIKKESAVVTARATTSLDKLKAIYERVQAIKNLSYVKEVTPSRGRDNKSVGDVLRNNAGLRSDITRAFVALARSADIKADLARVVTRDDKFFHENILGLYGQFDSEVAVVDVDGREMYFDPATPGCPLGLLRWSATDTTFIRTSGEPGKFYTTPLDPPERSLARRTFDLRLGPDGGLTGTVTLTCTGQEALGIRLDHLGLAEEEMTRSLGDKMAARLPEGSRASVLKMENMSGSGDEVRIVFGVAIPAAATPAGDRMLLPVVPYRATWRDSFRHMRRTSSVYFPYLVRESDEIVIALPDGMRIESVPAAAGSERSFSRYSLSAEAEGGTTLRVRRELTILKNRVPVDQYPVLKSFFDQARAGDEGQVVLAVEKK